LKNAPGLLPGTPSEPLIACSKCYQSPLLTTHRAKLAWNKAKPKTTVQPPDIQLASLGELVHSIIPQERRDQLIGFNFNFSKKLPKSVRRTSELMRTLTMILDFIFALAVPDEDKPQALELLLQTRWATKLLKVEAGKDIETLRTTGSLINSYKSLESQDQPACANRRQILSLVVQEYSRHTLREAFGCSNLDIAAAKMHAEVRYMGFPDFQ